MCRGQFERMLWAALYCFIIVMSLTPLTASMSGSVGFTANYNVGSGSHIDTVM